MEIIDDGKMDKMPQLKQHFKPFNVFDVRNAFASFIPISAKKLYKLCFPDEDQKLSSQFDVVNVLLSNSKISISSLVNFPSDKIKVQVPTDEPISFGIHLKSLMRALRLMTIVGKEIHRIVLAYQAEKDLLVIADGRTEVFINTVACTKEELSS
ncbi:hypothetical protein MKX03_006539 [Papaver bracteatum]|nr:hypothetical protein MKX03_006539 [Papaver bracteatum]